MGKNAENCRGSQIITTSSPLMKEEKKIDNCKGKSFKITINNYSAENLHEYGLMIKNLNPFKWVYSLEIGEEGTPHIQGYIRFHKETRRSSIMRCINKGFYCELSKFHKGSNVDEMDEEQWLYCVGLVESKGMIYNPTSKHNYDYFPPPPIEILEDDELRPFQKDLENILLGEVNKNKIYWIYDEEGQIGKTEMVRRWFVKYGVPFAYGGKTSDIVNLVFNNKKYFLSGNKKAMVYNFGRSTKNDRIAYNSMETISDGAISNTKFEAGCFVMNKPHIFVFANCLPCFGEMTSNRWIIKTVSNMELKDYNIKDSLELT